MNKSVNYPAIISIVSLITGMILDPLFRVTYSNAIMFVQGLEWMFTLYHPNRWQFNFLIYSSMLTAYQSNRSHYDNSRTHTCSWLTIHCNKMHHNTSRHNIHWLSWWWTLASCCIFLVGAEGGESVFRTGTTRVIVSLMIVFFTGAYFTAHWTLYKFITLPCGTASLFEYTYSTWREGNIEVFLFVSAISRKCIKMFGCIVGSRLLTGALQRYIVYFPFLDDVSLIHTA